MAGNEKIIGYCAISINDEPAYSKIQVNWLNCEDYVNTLKMKGIQFDQEPTDQRYLWREARLKDLGGNQLILFYGGDNRMNLPWRLKEN